MSTRNNKPSFYDQMREKINKSTREGNHAAVQYYTENLRENSACVSFEHFCQTWAGERWLERRGFALPTP